MRVCVRIETQRVITIQGKDEDTVRDLRVAIVASGQSRIPFGDQRLVEGAHDLEDEELLRSYVNPPHVRNMHVVLLTRQNADVQPAVCAVIPGMGQVNVDLLTSVVLSLHPAVVPCLQGLDSSSLFRLMEVSQLP